jgi:hypothetical protein
MLNIVFLEPLTKQSPKLKWVQAFIKLVVIQLQMAYVLWLEDCWAHQLASLFTECLFEMLLFVFTLDAHFL